MRLFHSLLGQAALHDVQDVGLARSSRVKIPIRLAKGLLDTNWLKQKLPTITVLTTITVLIILTIYWLGFSRFVGLDVFDILGQLKGDLPHILLPFLAANCTETIWRKSFRRLGMDQSNPSLDAQK